MYYAWNRTYAQNLLVEDPEGKRPLCKLSNRHEDNVKIDLGLAG
jgi:hypothetical protein